jgi:hypothetical protein
MNCRSIRKQMNRETGIQIVNKQHVNQYFLSELICNRGHADPALPLRSSWSVVLKQIVSKEMIKWISAWIWKSCAAGFWEFMLYGLMKYTDVSVKHTTLRRTPNDKQKWKNWSCFRYRPRRPVGLWNVEDTALSGQSTQGGSEVVILTHRPRSALQKHCFISDSGPNFGLMLNKLQGLVRPEGLDILIKFSYIIESRTRDLPTCSIAPQALRYRVRLPKKAALVKQLRKCLKYK